MVLSMQRVFVVGGFIRGSKDEKGNVFSVPSNKYAEFNMFLDPLAAKVLLESRLNITLIPLAAQRKVASFEGVLGALEQCTHRTPESTFVHRLLSMLKKFLRKDRLYHHMVNNLFLDHLVTYRHSCSFIMLHYIWCNPNSRKLFNSFWLFPLLQDIFLGEVLGSVYMVQGPELKPSVKVKPLSVVANTAKSTHGQISASKKNAKILNVLDNVNSGIYYTRLANSLSNKKQSAVVGSFEEQKSIWSRLQK
jgi:hypothetical protein